MSRAEQIFVCTHIIQVLCITQRDLHFISFQMFCSALVSLCIDVHFSHTYHSQLCPLSHSQSLCNSPGMLPKSLSSVQSPVRMWDSPLCFISTLRKQPWKKSYATVQWSLPNDKTRGIVFSSRKLFLMFLGTSWSATFWSCVCLGYTEWPFQGAGAVVELEDRTNKKRGLSFSFKLFKEKKKETQFIIWNW